MCAKKWFSFSASALGHHGAAGPAVGEALDSLSHLMRVVSEVVSASLVALFRFWFRSGSITRPESDIVLPQQYLDLLSHPGFLVGIHPEVFFHGDVVDTEVDVGGAQMWLTPSNTLQSVESVVTQESTTWTCDQTDPDVLPAC